MNNGESRADAVFTTFQRFRPQFVSQGASGRSPMTYKSRLLIYVGTLFLLMVAMIAEAFRVTHGTLPEPLQPAFVQSALSQQHRLDTLLGQLRRQARSTAQAMSGGRQPPDPVHDGRFDRQDPQADMADARQVFVYPDGRLAEPAEKAGAGLPRLHDPADPGDGLLLSASGRQSLLTASAPVRQGGRLLGHVLVAYLLSPAKLQGLLSDGARALLLVTDGDRVISSSQPGLEGRFAGGGSVLDTGQSAFRLAQLAVPADAGANLQLVLGLRDQQPDGVFSGRFLPLWLMALLAILFLLTGMRAVRGFERSVAVLTKATRQVMDGQLPHLERCGGTSELGTLINRFADVIEMLRRKQSEVEQVHRQLQHTAITDSMTGLYNRRHMQELVPVLMAQIERDRRYLTAVLMDLDNFKCINDRYGHLGGDAVIVHFTRILTDNCRASDYLFRIGGEEFLILNLVDSPHESFVLAEKIRLILESSMVGYEGADIAVTVSAGISCCFGPQKAGALSRLMREADQALYQAKAGGRNKVVQHTEAAPHDRRKPATGTEPARYPTPEADGLAGPRAGI